LPQIRGSIPTYWKQESNGEMRPPIVANKSQPDNAEVLLKHINSLRDRYFLKPTNRERLHPSICFVNLIDKKGSQASLGRIWIDAISNISAPSSPLSLANLDDRSEVTIFDRIVLSEPANLTLRYIWWDYHKCLKQFSDLLKLQPSLHTFIKSNSSFFQQVGKQIVRKQDMIIRTNCVDCLDRTNVMQVCLLLIVLKSLLILFSYQYYTDDNISMDSSESAQSTNERFAPLFAFHFRFFWFVFQRQGIECLLLSRFILLYSRYNIDLR
jgi:hypothetical protein